MGTGACQPRHQAAGSQQCEELVQWHGAQVGQQLPEHLLAQAGSTPCDGMAFGMPGPVMTPISHIHPVTCGCL